MPPKYLNSLTIPIGQQDSGVIDFRSAGYQGIQGLLIVAPATLAETITVEVATDPNSTFVTLQSAGTDVAIAATKGVVIDPLRSIGALKLHASVAVTGADRVFELSAGIAEPTG